MAPQMGKPLLVFFRLTTVRQRLFNIIESLGQLLHVLARDLLNKIHRW